MKSVYVKIALLGAIGMTHSASMCMLQVQKFNRKDKATQEVRNAGSELKKNGSRTDFSRLPLYQENTQENCFTLLSKDLRLKLYVELEPSNFKNPFSPIPYAHPNSLVDARLDRFRKRMWLIDKMTLCRVCKPLRETILSEDRYLAAFYSELSVARSLGYIHDQKNEISQPEPGGWCSTQ